MSSNDVSEKRPRVLFVYYSHTEQAKRVCDAMAEVLRGRGCDVSQAGIEFTDPHYAKNFKEFPFRHAVFSILPLLCPQLRRKTGEIRILLALLSFFGKGEMRERALGIKIPPTNLKPDFRDQAEAFANKLADSLKPAGKVEEVVSSPGDA